jgi:hypothetical protein
MRNWIGFLVVIVSASLIAGPARATLLADEPFAYPEGTLTGANGGTGWNGGWTASGNGVAQVLATGLTYTDAQGNELATSGGSVLISAPNSNTAQFFRLTSATIGANDGETTWWSFIGQRVGTYGTDEENLARAASLQLHNTTQGTNERLAVGKGTTTAPSPSGWGMLHTGNAVNSVYTNESQLQQSFVVVRIDHVGDATVQDNAWIWINPSLDQQPDTAMADASLPGTLGTSADFSFNRIRAFAGNTTAAGPFATFALDEMRFGTTYSDVAPIASDVDADFNNDMAVNGNDLMIWQRGLGNGTTNAQGDANGDGAVNNADLTIWKGAFGPASVSAASAVPEPASATLAAILGLVVAARRRR